MTPLRPLLDRPGPGQREQEAAHPLRPEPRDQPTPGPPEEPPVHHVGVEGLRGRPSHRVSGRPRDLDAVPRLGQVAADVAPSRIGAGDNQYPGSRGRGTGGQDGGVG